MAKLVWDNIDAELTANHLRIVGKLVGIHGTIMQAQQGSDTAPVLSHRPFTEIDRDRYPHASDLLDHVLSEKNLRPVKDFNVMALSLVAVFGPNLMSKRKTQAVSLDFLLRLCIKGYSPESPAAITPIGLTTDPSNSEKTESTLMHMALDIIRKHSGLADDDLAGLTRYIVMTCDNPLFLRSCQLQHATSDGSRSAVLDKILVRPGVMHQAMSSQEIAKFILTDGLLNAVLEKGRLTAGLA